MIFVENAGHNVSLAFQNMTQKLKDALLPFHVDSLRFELETYDLSTKAPV